MAKKEAKTNKKENNKNKKSFWKDFKAELKKVIWPTPKQLVNNTTAVVTIVLITAAIVFVLDLTFEKMNEFGIEKVKSVVETLNTENTESENNAEDSANEQEKSEDAVVEESTDTEENVENNTENNAE